MCMQVALITSMLPGCSRTCAPEGGEARDNAPEQLQDSITIATVDSYQASSCHIWNPRFPYHHHRGIEPACCMRSLSSLVLQSPAALRSLL